jgi:hypothetical protein
VDASFKNSIKVAANPYGKQSSQGYLGNLKFQDAVITRHSDFHSSCRFPFTTLSFSFCVVIRKGKRNPELAGN